MSNDKDSCSNVGMAIAVCIEIVGVICAIIGICKWVYGFFAYSSYIESEKIASNENSDSVFVWFIVGTLSILLAGLLIHAAKPVDEGGNQIKRANKRNNRKRTNSRWNGFSDPDDFPTDGYDGGGW